MQIHALYRGVPLMYPRYTKQQNNMPYSQWCAMWGIYIFHFQVSTASHFQNVVHVFVLGPSVTIGVSLQLCCAWRLKLNYYGKNWLKYVYMYTYTRKVPRTSPPPLRPQRQTLKKMASFCNDRISWTINVVPTFFKVLLYYHSFPEII